ncbi:hypothetical protein BJ508DRAFT_365426 [Ascobolus immersus RN42]|uniref:Uncharacterized protein n=1 Tax=Ascobolus immersus RN42 TaxID=1160509 RepID=A0A3N4HPT9_ASCIM|nr:hypothetical protein BJ508DRAFT_365426 [Ascobolus immersus RN42]
MTTRSGKSYASPMNPLNFVKQLLFPNQDTSPAHVPNAQQQRHTYLLLTKKVPAEIALAIIDHAEYWVKDSTSRAAHLTVTEGNSPHPYMISNPVRGRVQSVTFTITSHDQGWSSDNPRYHGTYDASWTWFTVGVIEPGDSGPISWKDHEENERLATNRHAVRDSETQIVTVGRDERDWVKSLVPGARVVLLVHARFGGWVNSVEAAQVDIFTSYL